MRRFIIAGLTAAATLAALPTASQARFYDSTLPAATPSVEHVACRVVRTRTRVGGRVVVKTVKRCGPRRHYARRCVNERVRVRTPAGTFVMKTVRRCR